MKGFVNFIREQGVVGLAVGFILGGAVSNLVNALVENIINPVIGVFLGVAEGLTDVKIVLGEAEILLGNFISVLIDFIVVSLVVYVGVKLMKLDKLDKEK